MTYGIKILDKNGNLLTGLTPKKIDELAAEGEHNLETHINKAWRPSSRAAFSGAPLQLMPEYSYGIWKDWAVRYRRSWRKITMPVCCFSKTSATLLIPVHSSRACRRRIFTKPLSI